MPSPDIAAFLRAHFKSVWALELLLFLKEHGETAWGPDQLIAALRTSDTIVSTSLAALVAGGLVAENGDGQVRYAPASDDLSRLVDVTQALYASKPDAVRRVIVSSAATGLSAFADSFRLRND
jgi:DNA-binding transcriptional ArsR family regulator